MSYYFNPCDIDDMPVFHSSISDATNVGVDDCEYNTVKIIFGGDNITFTKDDFTMLRKIIDKAQEDSRLERAMDDMNRNKALKEENKGGKHCMTRDEEKAIARKKAGILTPSIDSIYANKEAGTMVIKWKNGAETKVQTSGGDEFNPEVGLAMAITKYVLGNNFNAGTIMQKYLKSIKYTESKKKKETFPLTEDDMDKLLASLTDGE